MREVSIVDLKKLYLPPPNSHKGENGRLLIIGGSRLFHAAGLWAAEIAAKIVDLVFFSSVPINLKIMEELKIKGLFRNGIVVPRGELESYLKEADCVLIGPGMVRRENSKTQNPNPKEIPNSKFSIQNLSDIEKIEEEGGQTRALVRYLLQKYPKKRWVIDGGALQEMEVGWIPSNSILTPHQKEFKHLFKTQKDNLKLKTLRDLVAEKAKRYNCVILLKGREDIICGEQKTENKKQRTKNKEQKTENRKQRMEKGKGKEGVSCRIVKGGNAGMTKGGTGDVLAGLAASFYCKNEAFLSALAASFFNKKAGERLFERRGYWFNASDLLSEIPQVLREFLL